MTGVLCEYRSILEKKNKAEKEYNDHSEELNSPEMSKKQQDMKEKVKQLEEIKRQCGKATEYISTLFVFIP